MFVNSFMGGALISFGCALALSTNSSPWFQTNAPGLIRTISAMVFPVGLISKSSSDYSLLSKLVVDRKSGTNLHCPTPSWNTEAMSAAFSVHRELRMFREIVYKHLDSAITNFSFFNSGGPDWSGSLHELLHVLRYCSSSPSVQYHRSIQDFVCQFLRKLGRSAVLHGSPHRMQVPYSLDTSNTNLETQTVAHSRVVRIKMKLLLSQKPNALLHNGIRSSSRAFSVSPFTN